MLGFIVRRCPNLTLENLTTLKPNFAAQNMVGTNTKEALHLKTCPKKTKLRKKLVIRRCPNSKLNLVVKNKVRIEKNVIFGHLEVGGEKS